MFQKNRLERELAEDIQEHLRMATEENLRRGMSPREASEAARRSFGGAEQMKEEFRDQRGIPVLETLGRETRIAFRSLQRAPGFAALAILTLALAIGANSAIFSAVNALLFHPAGISEPNRVVVVRSRYDKLNLRNLFISLSDFNQVSESPSIFASAAIAKTGNFTYTGGPYPLRLAALRVSSRWFEVFGAQPAQGRVFSAEEDQPNNNQVVVLSDAAWRRVFGSDSSIVGKTVDLDQRPYQIIGVMRAEYAAAVNELGGPVGQPPDLFVPLAARADTPAILYNETYLGVARLRRNVAFVQAQAFMSVLTGRGLQDRLARAPRKENGWSLFVLPYTDFAGGDMKTPLLILWVAVGFVLLIACANIAGLTLARTSARSRELAVRTALGGSRWHVLRHILAESFLLALAGSILGLGVAYGFIRGLQILGPENIVGGLKIPFDVPMLVFTMVAGTLCGLLFGIAPAAQLGSLNTSEALKEGARSGTAGRERTRFRSILVTAEVSLALVLSIGAALFLRSLSRLQRVDTGFRAEGVMTALVTLPGERYQEPQRQLAFYRGVIERLAAIPGVSSAAAAYPMPFGLGSESRPFQIAGRPVRENEPAMLASLRLVTPDFFSTLRIPLKRGRGFTEQDAMQTERVTIIDETLAQQYWPNDDPLGQRIFLPREGARSTVVGIVGHTKESDLASGSDRGVLYYSLHQQPIPFATLMVRTAATPAGLTRAMQTAVSSVDPGQPISDAKTMEQRVSATLAGRRFTIALLSLFAVTAVFLAALGLYGVINYGVTQRTQEIGIRMVLGAQRSQVLSLIVGRGLRIIAVGLALGWIAAFAAARLLPNQLFGVSAFDPATFAGMAILLGVVALFASYVPARRAMQLDPMEACHYE
jgi:predicted permease